jgi:polysaccharide biosynthesis transport protein
MGPSRAIAHGMDRPEQPVARILWLNRRMIGKTLLAALGLALIYVLVAPRSYTSTAQVYIDQGRNPGIIGDSNDLERSDNYLKTQCQVMTSTPILALALAQDGISSLDTLHGVGDPIDYLQKNVTADVGKGVDIIYVSLEAHNSVDAARIVNAIVQAYVTYQTKTQHSTSAEVLQILQDKADRDQADIAAKNNELDALRQKSGETAYDSTQSNPLLQQETALSNALTTARLDAVGAKAIYEQAVAMAGNNSEMLKEIEQPDTAGDLVAASSTDLDLLKSEIFRLQQSLTDLQRTYLPDHPVVRQTQSRLDQLTVTYVRAQRQHWLTAQGQEDALQQSFDQLHKQILDQASQSADFDRLTTELSRIEKDLDIVEGRINQVSVNQDAGSLNISILQQAQPDLKPTHPQKLKVLAGSLFCGLLIGGGIAVGREKFPKGGRPMHQFGGEYGLPVLGVLPSMDGAEAMVVRALQAHQDPMGPVAEAARSLARSLAQHGLDDGGGRTLLIASVNPLEGRTTLASNLAVAMAQSGLRVLLVDANNRAPRLHHIFKIGNSYGLFDVLSGRTGDRPAINATHIDGVDVLPCGTAPSNPVELLNNEALIDVLGELSDRYDRVIVDSPSLARGVETRILAANCTASILVTTTRPSARRHIEQGIRMLHSVGAYVLGLVINEVGPMDPLKAFGVDSLGPRHALSSNKAHALQPAFTAGAEV